MSKWHKGSINQALNKRQNTLSLKIEHFLNFSCKTSHMTSNKQINEVKIEPHDSEYIKKSLSARSPYDRLHFKVDKGRLISTTSDNKDISIVPRYKQITIDKPYDPRHKQTLKGLTKHVPELNQYKVSGLWGDIRGAKKVEHFKANRKELPKVFYHGTDSESARKILKNGILPRKITKRGPIYGGDELPSNPDRAYVTASRSTAKEAANEAARKTGSKAVVLRIKNLDKGTLDAPDEDSHKETPEQSIKEIGAAARHGRIPPKFIRAMLVREKGADKWQRHRD